MDVSGLRRIDYDAFDAYAARIDAAISLCRSHYSLDKLAGMFCSYSRTGDDEARELTIEAIEIFASDIYQTSVAAQQHAADTFFSDCLGARAAPEQVVSYDARQIVKSACDSASHIEGRAANSAFAIGVSNALYEECLGAANARMRENLIALDKSDKRFRDNNVRFAYVPVSKKVCGYCCMFASMGFVFKPYDKKSERRKHERLAGKLHDRCRCILVPGIQGKTNLPGYVDMAYYNGFMQLVKRDEDGEIMRGKDRVPLFIDGYRFDSSTASLVESYKMFCHPKALEVKEMHPEAYAKWVDMVKNAPLIVKEKKQSIHIKGTVDYMQAYSSRDMHQSVIGMDIDEAQSLVIENAGHGSPVVDRNGGWSKKETVVGCDTESTTYHNGRYILTLDYSIHYSKEGVHIVPSWEGKNGP